MKKYFILFVISIILFSCKKEEKDDSYNYLNDKLDEFIMREEHTLIGVYNKYYYEIKDDSLERKDMIVYIKFHSVLMKNLKI